MHTLAFSIKRADQSCIAVQRILLAPLGITPARADMLFAIAHGALRWDEHCIIHQSDLWRLLGVRPSVVSRMLKALALAGWVTRYRAHGDRRHMVVSLTLKGRALLTRIEQLASRFQFGLHVCLALRANEAQLHQLLGKIRTSAGDRARLKFPWCARIPWSPRNRIPRKFQRGVFWWTAKTGITTFPPRKK